MADTAIDVYLNDHLAGAILGSDLAEQLRDRNDNTPLGELMQAHREGQPGEVRGHDLGRAGTRDVHGGGEPRPRRPGKAQPMEGPGPRRRSASRVLLGRFDELINRAQTQYDLLEHERLAASRRALSNPHAAA